jgi:hypothetical protein
MVIGKRSKSGMQGFPNAFTGLCYAHSERVDVFSADNARLTDTDFMVTNEVTALATKHLVELIRRYRSQLLDVRH